MANKYSKGNFANSEADPKTDETRRPGMRQYEDRQRRLNRGARIMAIIVSVAMIVTAFLSAGVFFLK